MKSLRYLLDWVGVEPKGATAAEIAAFEKEVGFELLPEVREFFSICNGALIDKRRVVFMTLKESLELIHHYESFEWWSTWRAVPIVYDQNSNPLAVFHGRLLEGYVVQIHHDDSSRLRYRNLSNIFPACVYGLNQPKDVFWEVSSLPGDFSDSYRTNSDVETGFKLLKFARKNMDAEHEGIYQDAFRFGIELIPDSYINEVIKLLKIPDEYVYQATIKRLKSSSMWLAEEALKKDASSFANFIQPCLEHLKAAGINAKANGRDIYGNITISSKGKKRYMRYIWLYVNRNRPEFFRFLVEEAKVLLAR